MTNFTVGVEEEYFLVDAETRELRPRAAAILEVAQRKFGERVEPELNLAQIECSTPVCTTLGEVREHLCRLRVGLMRAAQTNGSRIVAIGTHPFTHWVGQQITPKDRYRALDTTYKQLAWEQLVSGCHVHVGIDDPELAIQVLNRVRPWLGTLRALTTNSPYWEGIDTGYASFRMTVFDRWPTTGMPPWLDDRASYTALVAALVATDTIDEESRMYWDVRPSPRYPTLEFRVADVCLTVDEAVMLTGLIRALVRVSVAAIEAGEPTLRPLRDLLSAARWRAARYGIEGTLVDAARATVVPAATAVEQLLDVVRDDLRSHGEWDVVQPLLEDLLQRGSGASRQRAILSAGGDLRDVVDFAVEQTVSHVAADT
jgi:carboxylate-amine ligase